METANIYVKHLGVRICAKPSMIFIVQSLPALWVTPTLQRMKWKKQSHAAGQRQDRIQTTQTQLWVES